MKKRIIPPVTLLLLLVLIAGAIAYSGNNSHSQNIFRSLGYSSELTHNWYTETDKGSRAINAARLNYYTDPDTNKVSIYHALPTITDMQTRTLALRTSYISFEVFLNDELYYSYGKYSSDSPLTNSPGWGWHFIDIPAQAAGGIIRIDAQSHYSDTSEGITESYYGKSAVILRDIILNNIVSLGLCSLLVFLGAVFMVLHMIFNKLLKIDTNLLYAGLFISITSIWSLHHTSIPLLFAENASLLNLFENMLLLILPIAIQIHIERTCTIKHRIPFTLSYITLGLNFIVQLILCAMDVSDFKSMLNITHIVILYSLIVMFEVIYNNRRTRIENGKKNFYDSFLYTGYMFLIIGAVCDSMRAYTATVTDTSFCTRLALIVFAVAVGIKSLREISDYSRQHYVSEMIHTLAYKDALTNLGNRTAFTDTLDETELSKRHFETLAVFIFDVNYLKHVNDTYGHQQGDRLIISCADCINKIFSADCKIFRIGGDEFAAIYAGNLSYDTLRSRINSFNDAVSLYNANNITPFRLRVAVGVAFMNSSRTETMDELFKRADRIMYENKRAMKETDDVEL